MALIAVLWGVALHSIVAVSFLSSGSASYRTARNFMDVAQVDAIGEAAVVRTVLSPTDSRSDRRWRTDGATQRIEFSGIPIRISVQGELGRIDINHADGSLLVRLFRAAGLDDEAASKLVERQ